MSSRARRPRADRAAPAGVTSAGTTGAPWPAGRPRPTAITGSCCGGRESYRAATASRASTSSTGTGCGGPPALPSTLAVSAAWAASSCAKRAWQRWGVMGGPASMTAAPWASMLSATMPQGTAARDGAPSGGGTTAATARHSSASHTAGHGCMSAVAAVARKERGGLEGTRPMSHPAPATPPLLPRRGRCDAAPPCAMPPATLSQAANAGPVWRLRCDLSAVPAAAPAAAAAAACTATPSAL
mmetsp:Transcript_30699/g.78455  ORF Transcript_30699/g.78455 Transcript_30699/m.78455 type:complete len:242 (+) Transcript_30699:942-1667(+)